jgi:tRNA(Arg) A34 adenosine deaminase TadA
MCYGAVVWSGVSRLVCGARKQDAEAIGFDEGPKPENWIAELEARGIHVITDVRREKATAVLRDYVKQGGIIYNSRIIRE